MMIDRSARIGRSVGLRHKTPKKLAHLEDMVKREFGVP